MKKLNLLSLSLIALSMTAALGGCSNGVYTIGVLFPVEHDALKLAAKGFEEALSEAGLEKGKDFAINEKNAGGDEAALQTMAKDLVVSSSMTLGLGTGASKALQSASVDNGKTNPLLFTAVTDPVGAKLVESDENGIGDAGIRSHRQLRAAHAGNEILMFRGRVLQILRGILRQNDGGFGFAILNGNEVRLDREGHRNRNQHCKKKKKKILL